MFLQSRTENFGGQDVTNYFAAKTVFEPFAPLPPPTTTTIIIILIIIIIKKSSSSSLLLLLS